MAASNPADFSQGSDAKEGHDRSTLTIFKEVILFKGVILLSFNRRMLALAMAAEPALPSSLPRGPSPPVRTGPRRGYEATPTGQSVRITVVADMESS